MSSCPGYSGIAAHRTGPGPRRAAEARALTEAGARPDDIIVASPGETGAAILGKGLPRIRSLLDRLEHSYPGRPVVLVNSDIFPAARSRGFLQTFLNQAPALALCREEVPTLETTEFARANPYRGGLDIFVFTAPGLARVNGILGRFDASERMYFGIPGWDFMLGAVVRSAEVGGIFMDSRLLLHEKHPQTYADVAEFQNYLSAMQDLGAVIRLTEVTQ